VLFQPVLVIVRKSLVKKSTVSGLVLIMAGFIKKKYGLIFALVFLILGFPFVHYHPDNAHTHQSELSEHHHEGHFHSNELSGIVGLVTHDSSLPWQNEEHHPHSDTDADANYFELNLQKISSNPVKASKVIKNGTAQKSILIARPTLFHPVAISILAFQSSRFPDSPKERSPPFPFV
jgi:hypothetical protein